MNWSRILGCAALAGAFALPLAAQEPDCHCGLREVKQSELTPNRRQGLWGAIGVGGGAESFNSYDGLGWSNDRWGGLVFAKAGFTVNQNLTIGGEGQLWVTEYSNYRRTLGSLMIIGQLYPAAKQGFFLKGGGGWTRDQLRLYYTPTTPAPSYRSGWGWVAGMGYDFRIAPSVSITPSLDFVGQRFHAHDERLINFGMAITFH